jgi:TolA-binding protein
MIEEGMRREVVSLLSGRMDIQVDELIPGERFLVVTDDAEVEVRGTRFEVEAKEGLLQEVRVISGIVEVRPKDRPTVTLQPGERWIREEPRVVETVKAPAAPIVEEKPKVLKKARKKMVAPAPSREPTPAERAFQEGWSAYRAGRAKEAAAAFDRVVEFAPGTPLADDAAYWKQQALKTEAW